MATSAGIPPGLVHSRYGIARELLRFPPPLSLPNFVQIALPLASHRRLQGASDNNLVHLHGSAFETSDDRALQVAMGEAVERYAGALYREDELLEGASFAFDEQNLTGNLIGFSEATYAATDCPFDRYDPSASIRWVRGYHPLTKKVHVLPAQVVIYDFPFRAGERITTGTTNGLACGRSLEAAGLAGLLEVIERDAFTCHWLLKRPPIPLMVEPQEMDPLIAELLTSKTLHVSAGLLITDIGVPVVLASIRGRQTGGMAIGASCRLDIRQAVRKAILEAGHCWAYTAERKARGVPTPHPDEVTDFLDHAAFYAEQANVHLAAFLTSHDDPALTLERASDMFPRTARGKQDFLQQYSVITRQLEGAGYTPIIFDRTSSDVAALGYHVVRAVVPGLQPLWAGKRWIPDDPRRLRRMAGFFELDAPVTINRDLHPFP